MVRNITLSFLLLTLSLTLSYSQIEKTVSVKDQYLEKEYRLTAYVHTKDSGQIEFWAYQRDKNGKAVKDKIKREESPSNQKEWVKISLAGLIRKNATSLNIGVWCTKTIENYWIDNIHLEINENNAWKTIGAETHDFENTQELEAWNVNQGYLAQLDSSFKQSGKQSIYFSKRDLAKYGDYKKYGSIVNVNGINLYYEVYGEGEPVLLLHGNNESIGSFRFQIDELRKSYKVIAVDSRGQGKSAMDDSKLTYELLAKDMNVFLNALKSDSVHILGWSDGGNTGLIMAMRYPNKVKSLTTMGANLYPNKNAVQKNFLREYKWTMRFATVLKMFKPSKWKGKVAVGKMPLKEPHIESSELQKIQIPVLVMAGEKDVIKESHTRLIADNIKGSKLVILKGLTHYAPQDDPEYFTREVNSFLKSVVKVPMQASN